MRRPGRTWVLAISVLVLLPALPLRPAGASTLVRPCQGAFANRQVGYTHDEVRNPEYYYEGVSAYLTPRASGLCTGQGGIGNFSGASIMITERLSGDRRWGQVGYERNSVYSGYRWFAQFKESRSAPVDTWYSPNPQTGQLGVRHTFRVLYAPACRCLRAIIDGTVVRASYFDPYTSWPAQPWAPQFFAETGWLESDVPGTAGVPLPFGSLGAQRLADDVVENMPCTMYPFNDNPARWKYLSNGCQNFTVWTAVS